MAFEKLEQHHELFLKAYRHNWDWGLSPLMRILKHKACDRGTAQWIYWHAHPEFYNQFPSEEIPAHAHEGFGLITFIEGRFERYPHKIAFDPAADSGLTVPDPLGRIPPEMVTPTIGSVSATDLAEDRYGELVLLRAAREGDTQTVQRALGDGFDINAPLSRDLLQTACVHGHADLVALVAEHGADLKRKTGASGFTPLHWASQSKRESVIETLLAFGVPIDVRAKWRRTALYNACNWLPEDWNRSEMDAQVAFLLLKGADPLAKDSDKKTPLDIARSVGNDGAVALLEKHLAAG
ncbi:MAG: DUF4274 domain-containing protein [Myxococcota bacterium]